MPFLAMASIGGNSDRIIRNLSHYRIHGPAFRLHPDMAVVAEHPLVDVASKSLDLFIRRLAAFG
jgi:hypothetical protein